MDLGTDKSNGLHTVVFCPGPMGIFEQSLSLQERGWLGAMFLDHYYDLSKPLLRRMSGSRINSYLRKRYHPQLDAKRAFSYPWPAFMTKIGTRFSNDEAKRCGWINWYNAQFDQWVASRLPRFGNLAFGYESSSLYTFRRARELGMPRVLYQPIACAEKAVALLEEEKASFPKLAETLRYNWFPADEMERKREERDLADAIVCASNFTKQSLIEVGVPADKIFVEPYGVNQDDFSPSETKYPNFSVIWAGALTQTKGVGYLLEALARKPIPGIELVVAGHTYGRDALALYEDRVRVRRLGQISREQVGKAMARCHAHVFPTLLEGFGRNIIEAMASGLPVITTANCAGPDLIEDGVNGFIIPIRDVDAICEKLAWVYEHPEAAAEMGRRARARVAGLTQANYRQRFADRIHEVWQARS